MLSVDLGSLLKKIVKIKKFFGDFLVKFEIPLPPWDWRAASDERLEEGRKGDGKFENEDKCFKVCVFVEKGDVVGES